MVKLLLLIGLLLSLCVSCTEYQYYGYTDAQRDVQTHTLNQIQQTNLLRQQVINSKSNTYTYVDPPLELYNKYK